MVVLFSFSFLFIFSNFCIIFKGGEVGADHLQQYIDSA